MLPDNALRCNPPASKDATPSLSPEHSRTLLKESGIAPEIVGGRGYRTVRRGEVPDDFADYQRRNGLLIPLYSPDGITTGYQLRADKPRRDKRHKPIRYETPTGGRIIADVHPRMLGAVADPSVPLWITEGAKKGDALASRGRCAVSLVGVWMFRPKDSEEMLPCFDHIALSGRRVFVVYDSDVMRKVEVAMALDRLVGDLERRGARPLAVYLPDAPDGSKQGADDYLAAGGTVEWMEENARAFNPEDAARERMHRNAPIRDRIAAMWHVWRCADWRGRGGHTRREVMRALLEDGERRGARTHSGVLVSGALRPLAERVGVSQKAIANALAALEADGFIAEDKTPRPAHKGRFYVLLAERAKGRHKGKKQGSGDGRRGAQTERRTQRGESDHGAYLWRGGSVRAENPHIQRTLGEIKRLRWSYSAPVYDPARRTYVYDYVQRLGKIDGRVVELLNELGGAAPIEELAELLGQRVRDFRRRSLTRLQAAELVMVEGSRVSLAADWPEKLGIARELGGEYRAERLKQQRHREGRKAYREHRAGKNKADRAPTQAEMDADPRREARQQRRRIDALTAQGMRSDFASRSVIGADGYIGDLTPASARCEASEAQRSSAEHPLSCECLGCSVTARRYATPFGGAT